MSLVCAENKWSNHYDDGHCTCERPRFHRWTLITPEGVWQLMCEAQRGESRCRQGALYFSLHIFRQKVDESRTKPDEDSLHDVAELNFCSVV